MNTKLPKKCNDCRTKYIIVWDNEKTEKYENEKNLRICSMCRK